MTAQMTASRISRNGNEKSLSVPTAKRRLPGRPLSSARDGGHRTGPALRIDSRAHNCRRVLEIGMASGPVRLSSVKPCGITGRSAHISRSVPNRYGRLRGERRWRA